jgi:general secretion pathway protein G
MQALKLYKLDNQRYPSGDAGLQRTGRKTHGAAPPPNWKPYLERLPADPWGNAYQYLNPGTHGEVDVLSLRRRWPARRRGQANADVGSW